MSIDLARDIFVDQQTSAETRRAYGRDLRVFFDWLNDVGQQAEEINQRGAIEFRDYLVQRYAPNGAARVWATVKGLYRQAQLPNPFDLIKGPKRISNVSPKVPSDEDVNKLVDTASIHPQRSLIISLLLNGLRASEVAGLLKSDVERHQDAMILRVIGKGSKERLVPAIREVEKALANYNLLASPGQANSAYVVSDAYGRQINYRQVEHATYKTSEYAGIEPPINPHSLRHHFATRLIRAGIDVSYVKQLLGHARLDTTAIYVTLNLADLIAAAAKDPRNVEVAA